LKKGQGPNDLAVAAPGLRILEKHSFCVMGAP
jgi:hypothetical protein